MKVVKVEVKLNGRRTELELDVSIPLLDALRSLNLWSVKRGCETGDCGVCTVLVDGLPRTTCNLPAVQTEGRSITTLESIGRRGDLHLLQEVFLDRGAVQCGFCTPAMLLVAKALLENVPRATEDQVRRALAGVLCRCTGYVKPVEAVLEAARRLAR